MFAGYVWLRLSYAPALFVFTIRGYKLLGTTCWCIMPTIKFLIVSELPELNWIKLSFFMLGYLHECPEEFLKRGQRLSADRVLLLNVNCWQYDINKIFYQLWPIAKQCWYDWRSSDKSRQFLKAINLKFIKL